MAEIDVFRRLLLPSTLMLLVACWLGGGVTQDDTSIDEWLQLLALPVLAIAAMTLMVDWPKARTVQCGIVVALMVALVPALQLLPLPIGWWSVGTRCVSVIVMFLPPIFISMRPKNASPITWNVALPNAAFTPSQATSKDTVPPS